MDRKRGLEAPHNEELKTITQLEDRSELSTLYGRANTQWDGEIVTPEERERRRQHHQETLSFGIRKQFWLIGLLAPLPLVLLSLLIGTAFAVVTDDNAPRMVIPGLILFSIWGALSFWIFRDTFDTFYKHGVRALPFITTLVLFLALSIQTVYLLTLPVHGQHLMGSVLLVSGLELLWSVILSYSLLILWTTPKLSGNVKVLLIAAFAFVLLCIAAALTFAHM